jgi:hypothetical protein
MGPVEAVRKALDAYVDALDARALAELCERTGVPTRPSTLTPEAAAIALCAAVEALPELNAARASAPLRPTPEPEPIEPAPLSVDLSTANGPLTSRSWGVPSEARTVAVRPYEPPPSGSESRIRASAAPLDAEGEALKAEFESIDYESLSDLDFSSYATEFAALARLRQERGLAADGSELESRIIRRLTALAHQRNLPRPVFGLSRSHRGDWEGIARRAREERERRFTSSTKLERAAVSAPSSKMPKSARTDGEEGADDDAREEEPLDLPRLRARASQAEVVLVGGVVKNEKLDRVRARTGIEVDWVGLDVGKSAAAVTALAKRIRDGRLAALVLLNGLLDHKQSEPLISAARDVGLPVAYADKAGKGALVKAFVELERRLGDE